jgi:hypothetical protein
LNYYYPTAKSGLPSPSKSPMANETGPVPVVKSTLVAKLLELMLPLLEVLRYTETVVEPEFATAKSGLPSPSKSPMATERGLDPVMKSTLAAKLLELILPLVEVLRNTETVSEPLISYRQIRLAIPIQIAYDDRFRIVSRCKINLGSKTA